MSSNKDEVYLLTTKDNPFNPFTEFSDWYEFDNKSGYKTCQRIARLSGDDQSRTSIEEDIANEEAINQIMSEDFLGIYKRVKKSDYK